jgi:hypothetical protein
MLPGFLADCDRQVADLVPALRGMVLEEAPDAVEKVYKNHPSALSGCGFCATTTINGC